MVNRMIIGFIGAGRMAEAIVRGLINAGVDKASISVSDTDAGRRELFEKDFGVTASDDNKLAAGADVVLLAVKPYVVADVLDEVGGDIGPGQMVVSIAAGVTTGAIESKLKPGVPVVRVMPNTPCLVGEGASALAGGEYADEGHLDTVSEIFSSAGKVVRVKEQQIDAVTGLSGSGPAYVYTMIEALTEGGEDAGLERETAALLAAQTVLGAARMVIETGVEPDELRRRVMTPGGTTVAGMAVLDEKGFVPAVKSAVKAAAERSFEIGKSNK